MVDEREFKQLKQRADNARRARDVATGQLEAALEQLRTEFECNDIEDAKKLLARLDAEAETAEAEFRAAVEKFKEAWGNGNDD